MKSCYEGLKEIGVDVDEIWRKMVSFRVMYRVVIPSSWSSNKMKACYEGLKEIGVDVDEIRRKMLGFRVSIGLLPLDLIHFVKWKPVMKVWKKSELMLTSYEGKC